MDKPISTFTHHYQTIQMDGSGVVRRLQAETIELLDSGSAGQSVRTTLADWRRFYAEEAHRLTRAVPHLPAEVHLLQRALARGEADRVAMGAREFLEHHEPEPWIRPVSGLPAFERDVCLAIVNTHQDAITAARVHPDGCRVITSGKDGSLKVWDLETGACLRALCEDGPEVSDFYIAVDGTRLVCAVARKPVIQILDLETAECVRSIKCREPMRRISLHPDGDRIAGMGEDGVHVWSIDSGHEHEHFRSYSGAKGGLLLVGDWVVTTSPRRFGYAMTVRSIEGRPPGELESREYGGPEVAPLPDGRTVLWGGLFAVGVVDLETCTIVQTLDRKPREATIHVSCMGADGAGKLALVSGPRTPCVGDPLDLWDLESARRVRYLFEHKRERSSQESRTSSRVQSIDWHSDQMRAITADGRGEMIIWDLSAATETRLLGGHTSGISALAFEPRAERLVSADQGGTIKIWDWRSGQCLRTLEGPPGGIASLSVHQTSGRILSHGYGEADAVCVWDMDSGECLKSYSIPSVYGQEGAILDPAGLQVIASGKCFLRAMPLDRDEPSWQTEINFISLALMQVLDQERFITVSYSNVHFWSFETGQLIRTINIPGGCKSAALHPDGRTLLLAYWSTGSFSEHRLLLFDTATEKVTLEIVVDGGVYATSITPDGKYALSTYYSTGCRDSWTRWYSSLDAWDLESGEHLATFPSSSSLTAIDSASNVIAVGTGHGHVMLLELHAPIA